MVRNPTARAYSCDKCPLRANDIFTNVSDKHLDFIKGFKSSERPVKRGATIIDEGVSSTHIYTVLSGWGYRSKQLPDGRRQILNYVFPGDLIGLQSAVADEMQHTVEALSDMRLCCFERRRLWELYQKHPPLAYDITWLAAREEMLLDANLLSVGRRTARERTAFLVLHLFERARAVGMTDRDKMLLPLTQQHVADTLGLSLVHTNKTLRELQRLDLFTWSDRTLRIVNRGKLAAVARWQEGDEPRRRPMI